MSAELSGQQAIDVTDVINPDGVMCRVRTFRLPLDIGATTGCDCHTPGEVFRTEVYEPIDAVPLEVRCYEQPSAALAGHKAVVRQVERGEVVARG